MQSLATVLTGLGLDLTGWSLSDATSVSRRRADDRRERHQPGRRDRGLDRAHPGAGHEPAPRTGTARPRRAAPAPELTSRRPARNAPGPGTRTHASATAAGRASVRWPC
jgi:hypothetical protein